MGVAMAIELNPYLNFRDTARAAMEFYHSIFGGELTVSTFGDFHATDDPAEEGKVMHAALVGETGVRIMAADVPNRMDFAPAQGFSVSLTGAAADGETLRRYWTALCDCGQVTMPLDVAQWGDTFGMCVDKFGINWLVNIAAA